jgi:hypothetical protein
VQQFRDPRAMTHNQQVSTVSVGDEYRTGWSTNHPLLHGNPRRLIGHPQQCSRHDSGKFASRLGFLLGGWHRLTGERGFPSLRP